jgi:hypothetical protein
MPRHAQHALGELWRGWSPSVPVVLAVLRSRNLGAAAINKQSPSCTLLSELTMCPRENWRGKHFDNLQVHQGCAYKIRNGFCLAKAASAMLGWHGSRVTSPIHALYCCLLPSLQHKQCKACWMGLVGLPVPSSLNAGMVLNATLMVGCEPSLHSLWHSQCCTDINATCQKHCFNQGSFQQVPQLVPWGVCHAWSAVLGHISCAWLLVSVLMV